MSTKKNKQSFIKDGYIQSPKLFDSKKCKSISVKLEKKFNLKNIFLSENEFLNNKIKIKKKKKNILSELNLNFIIKNKNFQKLLESILGKNYYLYASRAICGVPARHIPEWIKDKMIVNSPNLNLFIKEKFKSMRYFNGIDYHMDLIDFKKEKSDFVTVYVYLDKVTKNMSPLNLLLGSHYGGAQTFPHKILKKNDDYIYYFDNKRIFSKKKKLIGSSGDTWIWHGCLLHGSEFNISKDPRFSLRFIFRKGKNNSENDTLIYEVNSNIKNITAKSKMSDYKKYRKYYNSKFESTRKKILIN